MPEDWTWLGIDAYRHDTDGEIDQVEAYRGKPETGVYRRHDLDADQKVGFKADVGVPDGWGLVGVAAIKTWEEANYGELGELYAVWASPDLDQWGTVRLTQAADDIGQVEA